MDTLRELFHRHLWHAGGRSQLAGDHQGVDTVLGFFAKTMELTAATSGSRSTTSSQRRARGRPAHRPRRAGRQDLQDNNTLVFHVREGVKVTEVWQYWADPYNADECSPSPAPSTRRDPRTSGPRLPHPQVKIPGRWKTAGITRATRTSPLRGASTAQGPCRAAHFIRQVVAAGHEPLTMDGRPTRRAVRVFAGRATPLWRSYEATSAFVTDSTQER